MKQKQDWVDAAIRALRAGGIDAVRVEALARELGVTKGSFYWHFRDRGELLDALLAEWEEETERLVLEAGEAGPGMRLRRFFERVTATRGGVPDAAVFAWAAHDPAVAARAAAVERRRIAFFTRQLADAGLEPAEAERHAVAAYLATLGWIERAGRVPEMEMDLLTLASLLFRLVLPAEQPQPNA